MMTCFMFYLLPCFLTFQSHLVYSKPVITNVKHPDYPDYAIKYLQSYGYLPLKRKSQKVEVFKAVLKFQKFMGIHTTGLTNNETSLLMTKPRCPAPDVGVKTKRKNLFKAIRKYDITYSISKWGRSLPHFIQNKTIFKALRSWASSKILINVEWVEKNAKVDIVFTEDFDKEEGVKITKNLFLTKITTGKDYTHKVYLNNDVNVTEQQLYNGAHHAFGHVLGFSHGNITSNMFPIFDLTQTEKERYRRNQSKTAKCSLSITSVFSSMANGLTYFFKDSLYWRLSGRYEIDKGYPKNITQKWKGIPNSFDESFLWGANWQTYFFKGSNYYMYDGSKDEIYKGYPKQISQGWRGVPNNIDAAFTDRQAISYFFKGDQVYKYDNSRDRVAYGYPLKISSIFHGLPANIDSAFRYYYDGDIYFFKDIKYYKWNEKYNQVDGPFYIKNGWSKLCID